MPERNLVTTRSIKLVFLLTVAIALVSQVGCSKLRQSAWDDFTVLDEVRPSFKTQPTEPAPTAEPGKRFFNDPQKALDELNEAAGELGSNLEQSIEDGLDELIAEESVDAKIVGVSDEIDSNSKQVKLTATPPAPVIQSSDILTPFEPINRTSFEYSDLRPSATNVKPISSGLDLKSLTNSIANSNNSADCDEKNCEFVKPNLESNLPFAQPIAPSVSTFAPPSELVSQPLSPILFDQETRQVGQASESQMKNNALRRNETLEKPLGDVAKQEFDSTISNINTPMVDSTAFGMNTPIVLKSKKDEREVVLHTNDFAVSKRPVACASCESLDCQSNCGTSSRTLSMNNLQPIVASEDIVPEKVVIVATMNEETIPPFADPPTQDFVESTPEVVRVMPEADQPNLVEVFGDFAPVLKSKIEKAPYQEHFNRDLVNAFAPELVPELVLAPQPCLSCSSSQCEDPKCGKKVVPMLGTFEPIAPAEILREEETKTEPVAELVEQVEDLSFPEQIDFQATPIEVADSPNELNDFQPNGFIPSEQNVDLTGQSQWVAPTASFSPVAPQFEPSPMMDPLPNEEADFLVPDSDEGRDEGTFPMIDTSIPPEPEVIIEVIDNTVPWSVKLAETIDKVENQLGSERDPMAKNGLKVNLRLLEVLQRQMVGVEESHSGLSNVEHQYWQHQLDAINVMLPSNGYDPSTDLDRHQTAHQTLDHLRKAVERLERIANLKVVNGTFCTEISGFGKFKPFAKTTFRSGQRTLVYCEVENYLSQMKTRGFVGTNLNGETSFHTRLQGSYVIYDQQGRAVQQAEYPIVEDVSRKRRRDFYMYFPIQMGELLPGQYRLELLVEDLGGNKSASLSPGVDFTIE